MAAPRPRPQVMRLTEAAAERIKAVMAKADSPIAAVREWRLRRDELLHGIRQKDRSARRGDRGQGRANSHRPEGGALFLLGTEMDYKVEKLSAQFIFNNPNQTAACGCGESVQLEPAQAS